VGFGVGWVALSLEEDPNAWAVGFVLELGEVGGEYEKVWD